MSGSLGKSGTITGNVTVGGGLDCYYSGVNGQPDNINGNVVITGSGELYGGGDTIITGGLTNQGVISVVSGTLEIRGDLNNRGPIDVVGGTLKCGGEIINRSGIIIHKGATLDASQSPGIYNTGLIDYMVGNALLPANVYSEPYARVLTPALVRVQSVSKSGNTCTVKIDGYNFHAYQLQRSTSPKGSGFTNLGALQDGSGSPLTFTDTATPAGVAYYRVQVDP